MDFMTTDDDMRRITFDELQKVLNNTKTSKSSEPTELTPSSTSNDTHIDNIVFSNETDDANTTILNSDIPSSPLTRTLDQYVENFGAVEERLLSTSDQIGSSENNTESVSKSSTEDQLSSVSTPSSSARQIMISYNEFSFDICQKICEGLRNRGYSVWMDEHSLHGRILHGMAKAIESSSIVLFCYNENYFKSDYCLQEAVYTFQKRIDFIPCRLQQAYNPDGWLGILISDRLYIDFAPPNTFSSAFEKLAEEIDSIKTPSQTYATRSPSLSPNHIARLTQINSEIMREHFNSIIDEYKESINKSEHDLQLLSREELYELIVRLKERLFNENFSTSKSICANETPQVQNNDQMLRNLFEQSQNQTALLANIKNILSQPTDMKTIAKVSLAVLFVWTVKTHIIDAYLKQS